MSAPTTTASPDQEVDPTRKADRATVTAPTQKDAPARAAAPVRKAVQATVVAPTQKDAHARTAGPAAPSHPATSADPDPTRGRGPKGAHHPAPGQGPASDQGQDRPSDRHPAPRRATTADPPRPAGPLVCCDPRRASDPGKRTDPQRATRTTMTDPQHRGPTRRERRPAAPAERCPLSGYLSSTRRTTAAGSGRTAWPSRPAAREGAAAGRTAASRPRTASGCDTPPPARLVPAKKEPLRMAPAAPEPAPEPQPAHRPRPAKTSATAGRPRTVGRRAVRAPAQTPVHGRRWAGSAAHRSGHSPDSRAGRPPGIAASAGSPAAGRPAGAARPGPTSPDHRAGSARNSAHCRAGRPSSSAHPVSRGTEVRMATRTAGHWWAGREQPAGESDLPAPMVGSGGPRREDGRRGVRGARR